jgi:hypothetical protein
MSDIAQGSDSWLASDGVSYPPGSAGQPPRLPPSEVLAVQKSVRRWGYFVPLGVLGLIVLAVIVFVIIAVVKCRLGRNGKPGFGPNHAGRVSIGPRLLRWPRTDGHLRRNLQGPTETGETYLARPAHLSVQSGNRRTPASSSACSSQIHTFVQPSQLPRAAPRHRCMQCVHGSDLHKHRTKRSGMFMTP